MPAHREHSPTSHVQMAIPFPDSDIVGTSCQRAVLAEFGGVGASIPRREIRVRLAQDGHAVSTIDRSLGRLVAEAKGPVPA